jgi:predicted transcriptional regulator
VPTEYTLIELARIAGVTPRTVRYYIQPDRSQWERVVLHPDVELHIRTPLTRHHNKRVERLIALARQLFEEE